MCGIAGAFSDTISQDKIRLKVSDIIDVRPNRGPDKKTLYTKNNVTFGFRRLAINGLNNGDQPIISLNNKIILIVNGEIYNHQSIKSDVLKPKSNFSTNSDCEVILHLYERFGMNFYQYLDGMYALALYDLEKELIILARDMNGEKPLYFINNPSNFWFSSDLSSLINPSNFKLKQEYLQNYFELNYDPSFNTLANDICKLQPGTICKFDLKKKYIDIIEMDFSIQKKSVDNTIATLAANIDDAVRLQFSAEAPVGIALSGGLDSNYLLSRAVKMGIKNLTAITIGFADNFEKNEYELAEKSAQELGVPLNTVLIKKKDLINDFEDYVASLNEPIADFAGYSYYRLAKKANQLGLRVLIFGNGCDELFFGYHWMRRITAINRYLNYEIKLSVFIREYIRLFKTEYKNYVNLINIGKIARDLKNDIYQYLTNVYDKKKLYSYEITPGYQKIRKAKKRKNDELNWISDWKKKNSKLGSQSFVQKSLMSGYLCENGFNQIDSLTMHHSVEGRSPFVARNNKWFAEKFYENNYSYYLGKSILGSLYKGELPNFITNRQKSGFSAPIATYYSELLLMYDVSECILNIKELVDNQAYINKIEDYLKTTDDINIKFKVVLLATWIKQNIQDK